uniref:Wsv143-like protein n=1 Tax=Sicyonia whispovirus TaxID=2984283 RepID=A0A9C7F0W1_9VIRU|nr:MAG: wsv143-like protein [Sicyonia whispovirus]
MDITEASNVLMVEKIPGVGAASQSTCTREGSKGRSTLAASIRFNSRSVRDAKDDQASIEAIKRRGKENLEKKRRESRSNNIQAQREVDATTVAIIDVTHPVNNWVPSGEYDSASEPDDLVSPTEQVPVYANLPCPADQAHIHETADEGHPPKPLPATPTVGINDESDSREVAGARAKTMWTRLRKVKQRKGVDNPNYIPLGCKRQKKNISENEERPRSSAADLPPTGLPPACTDVRIERNMSHPSWDSALNSKWNAATRPSSPSPLPPFPAPIIEMSPPKPIIDLPPDSPVIEMPSPMPVLEIPHTTPVIEMLPNAQVTEMPPHEPFIEMPPDSPIMDMPPDSPIMDMPPPAPIVASLAVPMDSTLVPLAPQTRDGDVEFFSEGSGGAEMPHWSVSAIGTAKQLARNGRSKDDCDCDPDHAQKLSLGVAGDPPPWLSSPMLGEMMRDLTSSLDKCYSSNRKNESMIKTTNSGVEDVISELSSIRREISHIKKTLTEKITPLAVMPPPPIDDPIDARLIYESLSLALQRALTLYYLTKEKLPVARTENSIDAETANRVAGLLSEVSGFFSRVESDSRLNELFGVVLEFRDSCSRHHQSFASMEQGNSRLESLRVSTAHEPAWAGLGLEDSRRLARETLAALNDTVVPSLKSAMGHLEEAARAAERTDAVAEAVSAAIHTMEGLLLELKVELAAASEAVSYRGNEPYMSAVADELQKKLSGSREAAIYASLILGAIRDAELLGPGPPHILALKKSKVLWDWELHSLLKGFVDAASSALGPTVAIREAAEVEVAHLAANTEAAGSDKPRDLSGSYAAAILEAVSPLLRFVRAACASATSATFDARVSAAVDTANKRALRAPSVTLPEIEALEPPVDASELSPGDTTCRKAADSSEYANQMIEIDLTGDTGEKNAPEYTNQKIEIDLNGESGEKNAPGSSSGAVPKDKALRWGDGGSGGKQPGEDNPPQPCPPAKDNNPWQCRESLKHVLGEFEKSSKEEINLFERQQKCMLQKMEKGKDPEIESGTPEEDLVRAALLSSERITKLTEYWTETLTRSYQNECREGSSNQDLVAWMQRLNASARNAFERLKSLTSIILTEIREARENIADMEVQEQTEGEFGRSAKRSNVAKAVTFTETLERAGFLKPADSALGAGADKRRIVAHLDGGSREVSMAELTAGFSGAEQEWKDSAQHERKKQRDGENAVLRDTVGDIGSYRTAMTVGAVGAGVGAGAAADSRPFLVSGHGLNMQTFPYYVAIISNRLSDSEVTMFMHPEYARPVIERQRNRLDSGDYALQVIADSLNAVLAGGGGSPGEEAGTFSVRDLAPGRGDLPLDGLASHLNDLLYNIFYIDFAALKAVSRVCYAFRLFLRKSMANKMLGSEAVRCELLEATAASLFTACKELLGLPQFSAVDSGLFARLADAAAAKPEDAVGDGDRVRACHLMYRFLDTHARVCLDRIAFALQLLDSSGLDRKVAARPAAEAPYETGGLLLDPLENLGGGRLFSYDVKYDFGLLRELLVLQQKSVSLQVEFCFKSWESCVVALASFATNPGAAVGDGLAPHFALANRDRVVLESPSVPEGDTDDFAHQAWEEMALSTLSRQLSRLVNWLGKPTESVSSIKLARVCRAAAGYIRTCMIVGGSEDYGRAMDIFKTGVVKAYGTTEEYAAAARSAGEEAERVLTGYVGLRVGRLREALGIKLKSRGDAFSGGKEAVLNPWAVVPGAFARLAHVSVSNFEERFSAPSLCGATVPFPDDGAGSEVEGWRELYSPEGRFEDFFDFRQETNAPLSGLMVPPDPLLRGSCSHSAPRRAPAFGRSAVGDGYTLEVMRGPLTDAGIPEKTQPGGSKVVVADDAENLVRAAKYNYFAPFRGLSISITGSGRERLRRLTLIRSALAGRTPGAARRGDAGPASELACKPVPLSVTRSVFEVETQDSRHYETPRVFLSRGATVEGTGSGDGGANACGRFWVPTTSSGVLGSEWDLPSPYLVYQQLDGAISTAGARAGGEDNADEPSAGILREMRAWAQRSSSCSDRGAMTHLRHVDAEGAGMTNRAMAVTSAIGNIVADACASTRAGAAAIDGYSRLDDMLGPPETFLLHRPGTAPLAGRSLVPCGVLAPVGSAAAAMRGGVAQGSEWWTDQPTLLRRARLGGESLVVLTPSLLDTSFVPPKCPTAERGEQQQQLPRSPPRPAVSMG